MTIKDHENYLKELKGLVWKEVKLIREISSVSRGLSQARSQQEKDMINSRINSIKTLLHRTIDDVSGAIEDMSIIKPLPTSRANIPAIPQKKTSMQYIVKPKETHEQTSGLNDEMTELEKTILKRIKRKEKATGNIKERKPSGYVRMANKYFGTYAKTLIDKKNFDTLKRDIIKANLKYVPSSYVSLIMFTTFISIFAGIVIFLFFMFFSLSIDFPFISIAEGSIVTRLLQIFWIIILTPIITFISMYAYPSLEKNYIGGRINQELPFATIHMNAISGSLVEPSKIFRILIETKEYPFLEKEFVKLINEINVYGYDFIAALRNVGSNSASAKLSELFNGIATTVNSGGDLQEFFEKRSQTLLFDYRIEREKYTKTAETFMDIYISLVIAAPMILMLLLIMMRVSGLGISLSTSAITLIMSLGVATINILFLTFLQLKQPSG